MAKRSEKQNRRWLHTKLTNLLWKIVQVNAYGSLRKQETLVKDLRAIVNEFEKNI